MNDVVTHVICVKLSFQLSAKETSKNNETTSKLTVTESLSNSTEPGLRPVPVFLSHATASSSIPSTPTQRQKFPNVPFTYCVFSHIGQ